MKSRGEKGRKEWQGKGKGKGKGKGREEEGKGEMNEDIGKMFK